MIKTLIGYAVVATALLLWCFYAYRNSRTENRRLAENQQALSLETEHYRTRLGEEAASVQALRLRCAEFETLRAADAERIRTLGIRLRRLEAAAKSSTKTELDLRVPLRDTLVATVVRRGDTAACAPAVGHAAQLPLARPVGYGRGTHRRRLGGLPRREHRYASSDRPPCTAPFPLHPLGHEGHPAGDRQLESPHADRTLGIHTARTLKPEIR